MEKITWQILTKKLLKSQDVIPRLACKNKQEIVSSNQMLSVTLVDGTYPPS